MRKKKNGAARTGGIRRKIGYLALMAGTLYLEVLWNSWIFLGLFLLEGLAALASGLFLLGTAAGLGAALIRPLGLAEKKQEFSVGVTVQNRSLIPAARVRATILVRNLFSGGSRRIVLNGTAQARRTTRIDTQAASGRLGVLCLEGETLEIQDFLRLFTLKRHLKGKEYLTVMPEEYTAQIRLEAETAQAQEESGEYDKTRAGDDPSEIFRIRGYQAGDRLQRIHWKMSARSGEWMVREYSLPTKTALVFFLSREKAGDAPDILPDDWVEAGLAVCRGLLGQDCAHYAVWFDPRTKDVERLEIRTEEDIYRLTESLILAAPAAQEGALEEAWRRKYPSESHGTRLLLNGALELSRNGVTIAELGEHARETLENGELWI